MYFNYFYICFPPLSFFLPNFRIPPINPRITQNYTTFKRTPTNLFLCPKFVRVYEFPHAAYPVLRTVNKLEFYVVEDYIVCFWVVLVERVLVPEENMSSKGPGPVRFARFAGADEEEGPGSWVAVLCRIKEGIENLKDEDTHEYALMCSPIVDLRTHLFVKLRVQPILDCAWDDEGVGRVLGGVGERD